MKRPNHFKFSTGRLVALALVILVQLVWVVVILTHLLEYSVQIHYLLVGFSALMILYIINKNENPAYQMSWIILISIIPVFGGMFYLMFGNKRPTQKLAQTIIAQKEIHKHGMELVPPAHHVLRKYNPAYAGLSHYLGKEANMPVYTNNQVDYFANGESLVEPLLEDLRQAKDFIFLEFFIVAQGDFAEAIISILEEKAKEGLDVRLIYDDFGSLVRLPRDFDRQMDIKGIKTLKFNPFTPILSLAVNTRDHRKIVVIDGHIAYTGGMNLADEYINELERFGYWKDNMIRVQGTAVWTYTQLFLEMWNAAYPIDEVFRTYRPTHLFEANQHYLEQLEEHDEQPFFIQPFGDSPLDDEAIGETVYKHILDMANDYVFIYTPYLVISNDLQNALVLAAKRGVDVRLMLPGVPDKKLVFRLTRSFYHNLIKGGVKIYEYKPGFLHAKTFISDDSIATIGSINLDYRSFFLHFEVGTLLYYDSVILKMKTDYIESQGKCRQIQLSDTHQSFFGRLWDACLRLMTPFA